MHNFNHPSKYGKMIVSFIFIAIIFVLAFYNLWNWLMPKIFGLPVVTIWEAIGLLALSKIVFGCSFGKHNKKSCKHKSAIDCIEMSEEEKECFKDHFKNNCFKK